MSKPNREMVEAMVNLATNGALDRIDQRGKRAPRDLIGLTEEEFARIETTLAIIEINGNRTEDFVRHSIVCGEGLPCDAARLRAFGWVHGRRHPEWRLRGKRDGLGDAWVAIAIASRTSGSGTVWPDAPGTVLGVPTPVGSP